MEYGREYYKAMEELFGGIPEVTEVDTLILMLSHTTIPHEVVDFMGRKQVCYPSRANCICDAVCHYGSYGHTEGLIEIMGLVDPAICDSVEGNLNALEVFNRIQEHYLKNFQKNS